MPQVEALRSSGTKEMFAGSPFPQKLMSANAYLGAFPIASALAAGADIVVTGRCVDSAVTLAPLVFFKYYDVWVGLSGPLLARVLPPALY